MNDCAYNIINGRPSTVAATHQRVHASVVLDVCYVFGVQHLMRFVLFRALQRRWRSDR